MPQTTAQILRCLTLGGDTARVEGDELRIRGPQPLTGPLPASIEANRGELITFLNECCGGAWPPAPGSGLRDVEGSVRGGLSRAFDVLEARPKRDAG
jgi:hypothetical protein